MTRLQVGVVFGGRSVEHEVSVITAQQVMAVLPRERFQVVPLYIAKDGRWFTGEVLRELPRYQDMPRLLAGAQQVLPPLDPTRGGALTAVPAETAPARGGLFARRTARESAPLPRLDVCMPLVHGSNGEDGTLQGLFELAGLAYCGSGVTASALAMDKPLAKAVWRAAAIPVLDDVVITRARWREQPDAVVAGVIARPGLPAYVKPATLGSSIGVSRAGDPGELREALDLAAAYCERIIIEPAQDGIVEVNCSVLGIGDRVRASVCEQPVASTAVLSYEDKYRGGGKDGKSQGMKGARRLIPAPIGEVLTARIRACAQRSFVALGCAGVARVDFLVRPEQDWFAVNEINPVPGSLSFYLWEPAGLPFDALVGELVDQALERHTEQRQTTYSFDSWLLTGAGISGVKR